MDYSKYKNTFPYLYRDHEAIKRWRAEEGRLVTLFHHDLMDEYGTKDNPKEPKLYGIAWNLGHSDGLQQVEYYYSELLELIT